MSEELVVVDAALTELALEDRQKRIARLKDLGAEWVPDIQCWGLDGKFYDENGELM